jgi:hypothetical protein
MREQSPAGLERPPTKRTASGKHRARVPDLGEPPIVRLGSRVGIPKAILTENDDVTLADLARIGRQTLPMRRRGKALDRTS